MVRLSVLLALCVASLVGAETVENGVAVPEGSRKVAERRYRSSTDWDGTFKFYKNAYPAAQYPRKAIVNQPGVKAVHLSNPTGRGGWEGLNIYEANESVRIFIVPSAPKKKKSQ